MSISHEEQRDKWNEEHRHPFALLQMDDHNPSSSVGLYVDFLKGKGISQAIGVEMGCGKGRNSIALSKENFVSHIEAFDFSYVAISTAKERAKEEDVRKVHFAVMDATRHWMFPSDHFHFGLDCAASTDIESPEGRQYAIEEMFRVLKPGAYALCWAMSERDEYHILMRAQFPAEEQNAFYQPRTGKFEKVFTEEELDSLYAKFNVVEKRRISKVTRFFDTPYATDMHWRIYQKPIK
ncbi:MAG: class I SAM-dependent methyltransferase [Patescibacteria group bacterium]|nr:class I SAM-dependent methyltransferase [Patescibacteria group bacterium]